MQLQHLRTNGRWIDSLCYKTSYSKLYNNPENYRSSSGHMHACSCGLYTHTMFVRTPLRAQPDKTNQKNREKRQIIFLARPAVFDWNYWYFLGRKKSGRVHCCMIQWLIFEINRYNVRAYKRSRELLILAPARIEETLNSRRRRRSSAYMDIYLAYYDTVRLWRKGASKEVNENPSKFFSALQMYCSHLSGVLLSYDSRSTLIRLDRRKNWTGIQD